MMVGVLAEFEFKADRESAAQEFFDNGRLIVEGQPATTRWYAFRAGPTTYGACAIFANENDRKALLAAGGPHVSRTNADLFERPPTFQNVDIVAVRE